MAGNYGYGIEVEMRPNDTRDLHERLLGFLKEIDKTQCDVLISTFVDDDKDMIVFSGQSEEEWKHNYSHEVITLLAVTQEKFGGKFKGVFNWYSYGWDEVEIQEWKLDGSGKVDYTVRSEAVDEDE